MLIKFSKDEYFVFLNKLYVFCDEIRIIEEDEDNDFIRKVSPYVKHHIWTRKFPGHGKSDNLKVLVCDMNKAIVDILKGYSSFSEVGCDDIDDGVDMAFYKDDVLVFHVLNHEDIYYLEDSFKDYFEKVN